MMAVSDYREKYAAQYAGGPGWFETVMVEARRRQVVATAARHPHRRLLEVGSGLEPLLLHLPAVEAYTLVEPVPEFCARARALAGEGRRVRVHQGYLEEVAAELGQDFDLIVVSSLLHEVPEPTRLLEAVRGLCAPQTVVHVNVPNVRSLHRVLALEMGLIGQLSEPSEMERRFGRHTRFDRQSLVSSVEAAGFEVLRFTTYFFKPFAHAQMEALFDSGIVDRSALGAFERLGEQFPEHGAEMLVEVRPR